MSSLRRIVNRAAVPAIRALGWCLVIPVMRRLARRRIAQVAPGALTVVTVNWNSLAHLQVLIAAVRRRSPAGTRVLVVDNGSAQRVPQLDGVQLVRLPANMGHDFALDLGVLLCRTEFVVAMDVDAFPLHERWSEELLRPLRTGAQVSGARLNRSYVHPCCWAMRTARFVTRGHSFRSLYQQRVAGRDASGDVGEEISARELPAVHFFEITSQRGPGDVGTVFGDLVYHNFYATRFLGTREHTLDGHVNQTHAQRAWREAVALYLPDDGDAPAELLTRRSAAE